MKNVWLTPCIMNATTPYVRPLSLASLPGYGRCIPRISVQAISKQRELYASKLHTRSFVEKRVDIDCLIRKTEQRLVKSRGGGDVKKNERLARRLENLETLKTALSTDPSLKIVGIFGWGHAESGVMSGQGISEYDTFFLKRGDSVSALQLDSSYQAQIWGLLGASLPSFHENPLTSHVLEYGMKNGSLSQQFHYNGDQYTSVGNSPVKQSYSTVPSQILSTPINPIIEDSSSSAPLLGRKSSGQIPRRLHHIPSFGGVMGFECMPCAPRSAKAPDPQPNPFEFCGCCNPLVTQEESSSDSEESSIDDSRRPVVSGHLHAFHGACCMPFIPDVIRDSEGTCFLIEETTHKNHSHFSLAEMSKSSTSVEQVFSRTITLSEKEEGCPCCTTGLDFDEITTAIVKIMDQSSTHESGLLNLADFDSAHHWGIFLGVVAPFSCIGLVAAFRNIQGSWTNYQKIQVVIDGVTNAISEVEQTKNQATSLSEAQEQLYTDLLDRLQAYKKTLAYSKYDMAFNFSVPGVVNGISSGLMVSTIISHHPFALPALGLYALLQCARNGIDLYRVYHHVLPELSTSNRADIVDDRNQGVLKLAQIKSSKKKFYTANLSGFTLLATGAVVTFISIPAVAVGVGAVTLPIGLACLASGAASTGYLNNVWPRKFRPRNGDKGINRLSMGVEECLKELGKRSKIKSILKTSKKASIQKNTSKRGLFMALTSLPWNSSRGERYIHNDNMALFNSVKLELKEKRAEIMTKIYDVVRNEEDDSLLLENVSDQWVLCDRLGIQSDILNIAIDHFDFLTLSNHQHCSSGGCGHTHDSSHSGDCNHAHDAHSYKDQLHKTGIFRVEENGKKVQFNSHAMNVDQKNSLEQAMDFYLHFGYIKKLRYESYAINDYYWELRSCSSATA